MRHTTLAILVLLFGCQPQQPPASTDDKPEAAPTPAATDVASDPPVVITPGPPAKAEQPEADVITGRVVRVIDGDTLVMLVDKEQIKVRLEGIDCPESAQPFGTKAKQALSDLVFGKDVRIKSSGKDRYDRTLGRVFVNVEPTEPDVDIVEAYVNQSLVFHGFAWHYKQYSDDESLAQAEQDARDAQRGLWAAPSPVPPWDWRKGKRE